MPVSFLTEEQERRYGRFAGEPSAEQLARYFHLDDTDRMFVQGRRGEHMRLGCALQLGTVRFLGTFLENPGDMPPRAVRYVADQLGIVVDGHLAEYQASRWRWRHPIEIRERYGYRDFTDPWVQFRLNRWLYALCWTGTDRPSVLFDRATAWLVANKVLLPGITVLERAIARVRTRASERLWRLLSDRVTPEQRGRLESLLIVLEGRRQSPLDRLRDGPTLQSTAELARAVRRLEDVRALALGLPATDRLPRSRVLALAHFAGSAKAQAVARLPTERRIATLLAFVRTLEASAQDDVLDLFDIVVTKIFMEAMRIGQAARLRTLRDLDTAAWTLRCACAVFLDDDAATDEGTAAALRSTVFEAVPRESITAALAQVEKLVRPRGDPYLDELLARYRSVRRFLPALLQAVTFGANPAGRRVLTAIHQLARDR